MDDISWIINSRLRAITSDPSHPLSEAVVEVLGLVDIVQQVKDFQGLSREATNMIAVAYICSESVEWTRSHIEETSEMIVMNVRPIQDFARRCAKKHVVLRKIVISITGRKRRKYEKKLAGLREYVMRKSFLRMANPMRSVTVERSGIRSGPRGVDTTFGPHEGESSRRASLRRSNSNLRGEGEETAQETRNEAHTTDASSGSRPARREMRGGNTVNPVLNLVDPHTFGLPSGSAHPDKERFQGSGYMFAIPQVILAPTFQSNIHHSRHQTTYGSYYNQGHHATNHSGSSSAYNTGPEMNHGYPVSAGVEIDELVNQYPSN